MTQFPRIAIEAGAAGMNLHSAGISGCESNNYLLRIALESVAAVLAALQDLSCAKNFGSQIRQCSRHVAKKAENVDQFDSSILFAATPDDTPAGEKEGLHFIALPSLRRRSSPTILVMKTTQNRLSSHSIPRGNSMSLYE